jgi:MFS family permease
MTASVSSGRVASVAQPASRAQSVALAVGGLLALASAMGIGRFVYTPILPAMAEALALSKSDSGLIASANFAGYLAGAMLTAMPRLPGPRYTWFIAALAVGALTTAGMAVVGSLPAFMLLRFVGGAASALVLVVGSTLVVERLTAAGRGHLAGLHFGGVGVGIAASAVLVDALQAAGAGWRPLWLLCGALAGAVIPIVLWLVPRGEPAPAHHASAALAEPGPSAGSLGGLCLGYGLFGFGYVVTATFLVAAVRAAPGAQTMETVVWVVVGLAAIPSPAIWGRLGVRWGVLPAYAVACLIEAVGVAAGGVWPGPGGALLASVLLGGTFMGIPALAFAAARTFPRDQQHRVFAMMTAAFGVGQIAGPAGSGWLIDRTAGYLLPSLMAALALVVAALIAAQMARALARASLAEARVPLGR